MVEHGYDQRNDLMNFEAYPYFGPPECFDDLEGRPRVMKLVKQWMCFQVSLSCFSDRCGIDGNGGLWIQPALCPLDLCFWVSPEISVVYRYGLPALLMLPFVTSIRNQPRESLMAFCGGLSMGLGALGYFKLFGPSRFGVCWFLLSTLHHHLWKDFLGSEFKFPIWFQHFLSFAAVP